MFASYLGKYKSIIVSVALFIILDASVLILNFYISFDISEDAAGVNLAGRQRMLSQRMVKSLLDIDYSSGNVEVQKASVDELAFTVSLFDRTLTAFDSGGEADAADGGKVILGRVNSESGRKAIEKAKILWAPYKSLLDPVILPESLERERALATAIFYAKQNNLTLLKLMNNLTVDLENVAKSKATRLRVIQTIGISLAIINFFIIIFHFIGELRNGDRKLEIAEGETKKILNTVNDGLFLVDRNYTIASQYSKNVPTMFGESDIAGKTLDAVLAELVSKKDMETSKRFIGLLFREDIKSNLIGDLNPLREIEVNIADENGGYVSKHLSFKFSRAYESGGVKNVLVTVNDVTEKVRLEREITMVKAQTEQHLEVLTGILHTNPNVLKRFVSGCFTGLHRINLFLREPAKTEVVLRKKLDSIFVEIHSIKGEAGALGLNGFQELAHKFESDLVEIKKREKIAGDDFFPLVVQLDKLIRHAETVENLSDKLVAFGKSDAGLGARSSANEWEHLHNLVKTVATRCGKKVELVMSGLTEISLSSGQRKLVNDVSVQCIRNAVFHGIELPNERIENYKNEIGRIDLRLTQSSSGVVELSIKDDGRGFDYRAIREQAIKVGFWGEQEMEAWDSKKLASLIFEPGFSTAQEEQMDAGRGVGMNIVKERIKHYRGNIRISSRPSLGTHFLISLPPLLGEAAAA
ncbi:MAG: two-component system chemotaxis sensor kinase CheA [Lentisphaeria bacterium]|jgi:two-component system chemotaxis sensor kinase CheA